MESFKDLWFLWALLVIAGAGLVEWRLRKRIVEHVQRQMNTMAAQAAGGAVPAQPEVPAAGVPELVAHDVMDTTEETKAARLRWTERALVLLRRVLAVDLGLAAAYLLLPLVFGWGAGTDAFGAGAAMGVILAIVATVRHSVGCKDYIVSLLILVDERPAWRRFFDGVMSVLGFIVRWGLSIGLSLANAGGLIRLWNLLPKLFAPRVRYLLSWVFVAIGVVIGISCIAGNGAGSTVANQFAGGGLLIAALLHATALLMMAQRLRTVSGSSLLVLRVFGIDETADFTFNRLMKYWRLFGHHFTIVDPALLRRSGKQTLGWPMRIALYAALFVFIAVAAMIHGGVLIGALIACGVGGWAAAALTFSAIDKRFVRGREQLLDRLARLEQRPRNLDLSFRHERALCHDDTWFMAVEEFARRAEVVLMDLRGFSEARKGCQKEVDFLFDTVPAARIVFLLDTESDFPVVANMIRERWEMQAPDSPNVGETAPTLQAYILNTIDEHDVQAIADLIIRCAETPVAKASRRAPRPTGVPVAALQPAAT